MCYFNQLGLPALIIHQVGELGRPAGREREGQGVPLIKGFREKKTKGKKEEQGKRKKEEMQKEIRATPPALVLVSFLCVCMDSSISGYP